MGGSANFFESIGSAVVGAANTLASTVSTTATVVANGTANAAGRAINWADNNLVKPLLYFLSGVYIGTEENDDIVAVNIFSGWLTGRAKIYAKGGDDRIYMASVAATVWTGEGNDAVYGGAADLEIIDDSGNLTIGTATGYNSILKQGAGDIMFAGIAARSDIQHLSNGNISFFWSIWSFKYNKRRYWRYHVIWGGFSS